MSIESATLSQVLDALEDEALAVLDDGGAIVAWNAAAVALTGHPAAALIGTPLSRLGAQDAGEFAAPLLAAARRGERAVCTHPCLRRDGSRVSLQLALRRVADAPAYVLRLRDRPGTTDLTTPSDHVPDRVPGLVYSFRRHPDGSFEFPYSSGQLLAQGGLSRQVLFENAAQAFAFIHPDDLPAVLASIAASAAELKTWRAEFRLCVAGQCERWVEGEGSPAREPDGGILWHGALHDIHQRKSAELALLESESKFRSYVLDAPFAMFISDDDGRIVESNAAAVELLGYPAAQLAGMHLADLHPEHCRTAVRSSLAAATEACRVEFAQEMRRADGHVLEIQLRAVRMRDGLTLSYVQDVTQRRRTERRQRLYAEVNRVLAAAQSLQEATPALLEAICASEGWAFGALWTVDERSRVLRCRGVWYRGEGAIEALAGCARALSLAPGSSPAGTPWRDGRIMHLPSLAAAPGALRAGLAAAAGLDSALAIPVCVGGRIEGAIEILGRGIAAPDAELTALFATLGDQLGQFLQRRRAQEAIERFMALSPAVIYVLRVTQEGLRTSWITDNVLALTGCPREDALDPDWWRKHVHPADLPGVLAAHPWPYTAERRTLEYRLKRADGSFLWVRDEKRLLGPEHGGELIGVLSDISERMELEGQLRQAQKMEAIGQLAAGVAHDFNNLLTVILGYSSLLISGTDEADPRRRQLAEIRGAGERAAALTRQLLAFSRKQLLEPRLVDLNEALAAIERMLSRLIGEHIELVIACAPRVSRVRIDPVQFEQIVLNLAVNARDAMPDGGRLAIETRDVVLDAEYCRQHPELEPGPHVQLVIADTGVGMTPEVQARIFEPFFTTKEAGKGTGLGLATVFGIVRQSEGCIVVHSRPGAGTRFEILLPAVDSGASTTGAAPDTRSGRETILLVEDEDGVRRVTRLMLEQAGYRVLDAGSGPEAIALAAGTHFDLLLTDVVMPELSGRQLAAALKREHPGLKVLFMSGYMDAAMVRHGIVDVQGAFVHKPFAPGALEAKLREVLGTPAPGAPART